MSQPGPQPASVFISYRRTDTAGHAGRLFDRLKQWFDDDVLFYDLDSIDSGRFPKVLFARTTSLNDQRDLREV
jgi:hypothetical protein